MLDYGKALEENGGRPNEATPNDTLITYNEAAEEDKEFDDLNFTPDNKPRTREVQKSNAKIDQDDENFIPVKNLNTMN